MINKKFVLTAVVSTILTVGIPMVSMASSNDLLRMDIKKSSAQDTVDVTFYTTGTPTNSVVTRKSGNSYVVLLPNVAGSQSVVPSLGGVKDLVSDISVKKVDDGIGGYTKIIFNTTKPVRILTSTKQTAPLTSAQQDYKNLIAQSSNIKPINNTSTKSASQTKATAPATKQTTAPKTTAQKPAAQVAKTTATTTQSKQSTAKTATTAIATAVVKPTVKTNQTAKTVKTDAQAKAETPKAKADAKAKTTVKTETKAKAETKVKADKKAKSEQKAKVETKVNAQPKAKIETKATPKADKVRPVSKSVADKKVKQTAEKSQKVASVPVAAKKPVKVKTEKSYNFSNPIVPIAGAFCLFGIFLLAGLANIITRGVEDKRNRLLEYLEAQSSKPEQKANPEFQAIMDDKKSNWQEKYRKYTKLNESQKKKLENRKNISYIANVKTSKGMIVPDEQLAKNKMQETISKMEHSLAQTPVSEPPAEYSNKYQSEDDAISNKMTEVKLKSFAPSLNLSETARNLVSFEDLAERKKKTLKEGKFVRMNNSNVTMSKRKSLSSGMNFAKIVRNNENYIPVNNETKQKEEYVLSSINEYMNILEDEKSPIPMLQKPQEVSKAIDNAVAEMTNSKSMATNPMISQRKSMLQRPHTTSVNGLNVKSSYNIDSKRSIYMVDLDGISAIIGKIGEEVFVLKKFDKVINKPMQVRLDYGNTYIVRVGAFKCLVDVTEDKMGTLLEI